MVTTLKFKLYKQNRNHQKRLNQYLYTAANVYNHCIALHKRHYALYGKGIKESKLKNHMAKLRRSESYSHWQMLTAQTVQDIVERIALSYKSFFNKTAKHLPGFKSSKFYSSITYKQDGYALNGNELTIRHSNLRLRFFKHREIDGKIMEEDFFFQAEDGIRDF